MSAQLQPRSFVSVERDGEGWRVTLSCGHVMRWRTDPGSFTAAFCPECLGLWLEEIQKPEEIHLKPIAECKPLPGFVSDARFARPGDQVIKRSNRNATRKWYALGDKLKK